MFAYVRLCSLNGRKIVEGAARGHRGLQNARPTKVGNRFGLSLAGNEIENSALCSGSLRAFFTQSAAPVWRFRPSRVGVRACGFTVLSSTVSRIPMGTGKSAEPLVWCNRHGFTIARGEPD
jgi:hypothetical protein